MVEIIHLGFALMLIAQAIRNILLLRIILILAQGAFIAYGYISHNISVAIWNGLFILINIVQIVLLARERRPVEVPEEIADIFEKVFPEMTRREFLYFWQIGKAFQKRKGLIIEKGTQQNRVLLILKGTAKVMSGRKEIAELGRGDFIAEMSFLTGEPASADVQCKGELICMAWSKDALNNLKKINQRLWSKLQHVLSRDLVVKVKRVSSRITS